MEKLKIAERKISELIFSEYNPRQISKDQFKALRDSIERFGVVDPIIINMHKSRQNIVIGGHQRLRVAEDLVLKSVPCVELDLTPAKERELNVRLNKNTGAFDYELLANNFDVEDLKDWGLILKERWKVMEV